MPDETSGIGAAGRRAGIGVEPERPPSLEDAVAGLDGPSHDKKGAANLLPDHTFDLSVKDQRGRLWTGRFKMRVLTIRDKLSVGMTRARLTGGLSPSALDPQTAMMAEILAHLSVAITERPEWANDLTAIHDEGVMAAIYKEVASYESRFHGADAGTDR